MDSTASPRTLSDYVVFDSTVEVACFALKPYEVLMCQEALHALGVPASDATWFVPDENRSAIQATVRVLESQGLSVHRHPEVRVRSRFVRRTREAARSLRATIFGNCLRRTLASRNKKFTVAVAGHNISAWTVASKLDCRLWIVVDSGISTISTGLLEEVRSKGLRGILEVVARRGKGLSERLRNKILASQPDHVVFFTHFVTEDDEGFPHVLPNRLPRLSSRFDALQLRPDCVLILGSPDKPFDAQFAEQIRETVPEVNEVFYKPHPREVTPNITFSSTSIGDAGFPDVQVLSSEGAAELVPLTFFFLPAYVFAQHHSTSLLTLAAASRGRMSTHVI